MVKMLGVYSVEGPGGEKADLVVMENLFYGYAGGLRMFDLKGMKGRRSKPVVTSEEDGEHKAKEDKGKTLFDGEWIDMQREKTILVDPHSKKMLREAIQRDAEFLTKGNIMDYSLLVGIGEGPERLLVVGLVDTIGLCRSFGTTYSLMVSQVVIRLQRLLKARRSKISTCLAGRRARSR